ncbi:WD40 repeat-like protein [Auriculariales sp. MPI-PUGE-AT-0066]|nr:WD40 repeat-like protein [Auriculariales sp. MPI-PUGE-AT-0066]
MAQAILVASAPALVLIDYATATSLATWKPVNGSSPQATALVPTRSGLGGFMLAVQPDKPLLHAFAFQKEQMLYKMVLPEKLSALAVDPAGTYCAGGTHTGRLFLWEIASGLLLNAFDAHYRQVTALCFSPDAAILCSGSEDSGISVWSMSRLLDNSINPDGAMPAPYCTFNDHTLAVSDLYCGVGLFPSLRLFSSSLDGSVKLWDIATRSILATFSFASPVSHLTVDPAERVVFAASAEHSQIYQVDLYTHGPARGSARSVVGAGETVHLGVDVEEDKNLRLRVFSLGKATAITSLALDLPGTQLLAGGADGTVSVFDVASHQLLRTFSPLPAGQGGAITSLATLLRPADLIGPSAAAAGAKDALPLRPLAVFHRIRDRAAREAHDVPVVLPKQPLAALPYDHAAVLADHAVWVQQMHGSAQDEGQDVEQLKAEVARLREQLSEAKGVNDAMWESAVQAMLVDGTSDASVANGGSNAKRQRIG